MHTSSGKNLSEQSQSDELGGKDEFFDENDFDAFEAEYLLVLKEMEVTPGVNTYYPEIETFWNKIREYFEEGRRMIDKYVDIIADSKLTAARLEDAKKIQQDDQVTIATLRKEIDRAWRQLDEVQEREQQQKELAHTLEAELDRIRTTYEQVPILKQGPEAVVELQRNRDELLKERDQLGGELLKLKDNVGAVTLQLQNAEKQKEQFEETIKQLNQENYKRRNDFQKETRRREKLELDMKTMKSELDQKTEQIQYQQQQISKLKENTAILEHKLKENKIQRDQMAKDVEVLNLRLLRLHQEAEVQVQNLEQATRDNCQIVTELRAKEDELIHLRQENGKILKLRDILTRKINHMEEQKSELEQSKEELKMANVTMHREIEASKRQFEYDKKTRDEIIREKDNLTKNLVKSTQTTHKCQNVIQHMEMSRQSMEMELQNTRDEVDKKKSAIVMLEKERDRLLSQASDYMKKINSLKDEMKMKDVQTYEVKKRLIDAETKLRQQINMYESVRSDRNLFNKNLIETQDEVSDMKRKLKILSHQIEQLKDELNAKDTTLTREHLVNQKLDREKETVKLELVHTKDQMANMKDKIEAFSSEQRRFSRALQDADRDMAKKVEELERVRSERDILGSHLVKRNEEITLLYQKIQVLQFTLRKGEREYGSRISDIRLLKLEIQRVRREMVILSRSATKVIDLRRELYHMQRELMRERTRCKALEEEMENPMNLHRWRKLQGNDPSTYELIQKIHTLQRRLIHRTEQVVEKEVLIREKEQLYIELKKILARQPRPEVASQVLIYQKTLRDKNKQMKAMISELNMYETQIAENKFVVDGVMKDLEDYKKKYYMMKKAELSQK
uniref:Cilia- and flagella-associated protein 58 central coiled coil domain-containing protein n=1 Tax=Strigamia maritima TaxID=126957 RepID=T1JH50_STRMM